MRWLRGLMLLTFLAAPLIADEPPPYPHAPPGWYTKLEAKLLEAHIAAEWKARPLTEVVAELGEKAGVKFRIDLDGVVVDKETVDFKTSLKVLYAIRIMASMKGWKLRLTAGGPVLTNRLDKYPKPAAVVIREEVDLARGRAKRRVTEARLRKTLLGAPFTYKYENKLLSDVLADMSKRMRANFLMDPAVRDKAGPVTASGKRMTLGEALTAILEPFGLGFVLRNELIMITTKSSAAPYPDGIKPLNPRRIDVSLKGKRARDLGPILAKACGMTVRIGPEAWKSDRTLDAFTSGTVGDLVKLLKQQGLSLERDGKTLFVVAPK